jgi:drug/metabolite transporter (DMT)-like permease
LRAKRSNPEVIATFCLFLTALIWGVSFVAQVVGMDYMRPFTFNGISFLLGAASLVPVILVFDRKKPDAEERKKLLVYGTVCGLILFAAGNFQQFGVDLTGSAGKAGFITGLYIIIVPIAGIFMKRPAGKLTWVGAVFAVVGMYFLTVQGSLGGLTPGDWLLCIGSFAWAAHIIAVDKFAPRVRSLWLSLTQLVVCGVLCITFAFLTETIVPASLLLAAVPLLYRGIGSIGAAYTLQIFGQRYVAPAKASVIFSLESVFSVIGGAILIHEVMTGRAYFGCALIFCGIILSQIKPKT